MNLPNTPTPSGEASGLPRTRLVLTRWGPPLLAFLPALVLALLIQRNAVNIPCWDGWEKATWLAQWKAGTLGWAELYAPHIEHRIVFPKLIILGLGTLSRGDIRWELAMTFLWTLAGAIALAALAKRYLPLRPSLLWLTVFVVNLILFSPIQWDNWLWGIQLAFMMPMACLCLAVYFLLRPGQWWQRLLPALVFALIGTHSFGHGMMVWPAGFGLILLHPDIARQRAKRLTWLAVWTVVGAAAIGCYFGVSFANTSHWTHAYGQGPGAIPPALSDSNHLFSDLGSKAHFFFTVVGNPLSRITPIPPFEVAAWFGLPLILFLVICGIYYLFADAETRRRSLPWLAIGGAALLGVLAVTLARAEIAGLKRATSIRYASIANYLWVAAIFLASFWQVRKTNREPARWPQAGMLILIGLMIPLWLRGADAMRQFKEARLQEKAAVLFINHWEPACISRVDAVASVARDAANILDTHGWMRPPLVKHLALAQFKPLDKPRPITSAKVELIRRDPSKPCFEVTGYARLPDRPADAILFTCEDSDSEPIIFATAEPSMRLPAVADRNDMELLGRFADQESEWWEWSTSFTHQCIKDRAADPATPKIIKAWVFDVLKMRAYRIDGTWQLNADGHITALDEVGQLALTEETTSVSPAP